MKIRTAKKELRKLADNVTSANVDSTFAKYKSAKASRPAFRVSLRNPMTRSEKAASRAIYAALENLKNAMQRVLNASYPKGEIEG